MANLAQQQLAEVQALRAFAALVVLLHHAAGRAGLQFSVGAAGVDVFFIISGFIMWTVTAQRPTTPLRFAWNRVSRIVPLYWLVTLGMAALAGLAPWAMPNLQPSPTHAMLSLLFIPHLNPAGEPYPLLVPGWTLNYEMFFYVVFAAVLVLPQALRIAAVTGGLGVLVLAGLVTGPQDPIAATYTNPLLLEFLAGIWLARLRLAGRLPGPASGLAMLTLGLGAYAALEITRTHSEIWRALLWGVPAWLIVAGTLAMAVGRSLGLGPARLLGDASYSIYLLHPLLVGIAWRLLGGLPSAAFLVACLLLASLAGVLCFHVVEKPMTEALKALALRPAPRLRGAQG